MLIRKAINPFVKATSPTLFRSGFNKYKYAQ